MKLLTLIFILITCNLSFAESDADLVKKGCLPRMDPATGNINGYDCNVVQNTNKKMQFQKLGNAQKVQLKNITSEMQMTHKLKTANDSNSPNSEEKK